MTSSIITTKQQLAAEISDYGIKLAPNSFISKIGISIKAAKSAKVEKIAGIEWPDDIAPKQILGNLTKNPIANIISFSVDIVENYLIYPITNKNKFTLLATNDNDALLANDLDKSEVLSVFLEKLRLLETAPPMPFRVEMGINAIIAFSAIIDRIKLLLSASLINRKGLPSVAVLLDDLSEQILEGKNNNDYRWMCTILPYILEEELSNIKSTLKAGCEELEELGVLSSISNDEDVLFQPTDALVTIALELMFPVPAVIFSNEAFIKKLAIFSGRSTWSIQYNGDKIVFENVDGLTAFELINDCLKLDDNESTIESHQNTNKKSTFHNEKKETKENDESINIVEEAGTKSTKICSNCGNEYRTVSKFCTSCGAATTQNV